MMVLRLAGLLLLGGCGQNDPVVTPAAEPVVTEAPTEAAAMATYIAAMLLNLNTFTNR